MNTFRSLAELPGFFKVSSGLLDRVGDLLEAEGQLRGPIAILCGQSFSRGVAERVRASIGDRADCHLFPIDEASEHIVGDLHRVCQSRGVRLVLSVGGGSIIDVGKRHHRLYNIPSVVVPTVISNDGLVSPISVLKLNSGERESLPALAPIGAVVDLDIIRGAPLRFVVAAAGDVLSNLSASEDWRRLAQRMDGREPFNDLAFHLAYGSAQTLVHLPEWDIRDDLFLENLVRCQIYSGLAMTIAGSSRPCSGAEHLISHAIDHMELNTGLLHGEQVGTISLFVLHLLGAPTEAALKFAKRIGLQLDWRKLSAEIFTSAPAIVSSARTVRPGRQTILDEYTDAQLLKASEEFAETVQSR